MESTTLRTIPGVNTWEALLGFRRAGFLDYIGELWQKYGDLFQINIFNRQMVVAIHPDVVRHVNVANRQNYEKLQSYDLVRKYILDHGLLTSNGELWRRQRQLMAPFYTPKGVQAYAEIMLKDGHRLLERWSQMVGKLVEVGEEMTFVTAAIILRAMFSMDTDEAIMSMKSTVETMLGYVSSNQSGIMIPLWIPTHKNREYIKARDLFHIFSLLESHILLALLAQKYAPRLAPGFTPKFIMGGTLSTSNGFPMIVERRSSM